MELSQLTMKACHIPVPGPADVIMVILPATEISHYQILVRQLSTYFRSVVCSRKARSSSRNYDIDWILLRCPLYDSLLYILDNIAHYLGLSNLPSPLPHFLLKDIFQDVPRLIGGRVLRGCCRDYENGGS